MKHFGKGRHCLYLVNPFESSRETRVIKQLKRIRDVMIESCDQHIPLSRCVLIKLHLYTLTIYQL